MEGYVSFLEPNKNEKLGFLGPPELDKKPSLKS